MFSNIKHKIDIIIDSTNPVSRIVGITKLAAILKSAGFNIASGVGVETVKAVNEWEVSSELDRDDNANEAFVVTFTDPKPTAPNLMHPRHQPGVEWGYPSYPVSPMQPGMMRQPGMDWTDNPQKFGIQPAAFRDPTQPTSQFEFAAYQVYRVQGRDAFVAYATHCGLSPSEIDTRLRVWAMNHPLQGAYGTDRNESNSASYLPARMAEKVSRWGAEASHDAKRQSGLDPETGKPTAPVAPVSPGSIPGYEHNPMAQAEFVQPPQAEQTPPISLARNESVVPGNWPHPVPLGLVKTSLVVKQDDYGSDQTNYDYRIYNLSNREGWCVAKVSNVDAENGPNGIRMEDLLTICADHLSSLDAAGKATTSHRTARLSILKAMQFLHGHTEDVHLQVGKVAEPT